MGSAIGARAVSAKPSSQRGMELPASNTRRGWSPKMASVPVAENPVNRWLLTTTTGPEKSVGSSARHATRGSGC
jgi:hypothetical protein